MILAVDTSTGVMHALGVQIKGPGEKNGVEVMETFIQDLEDTLVIVPSDGEPDDSGKLSGSESFKCGRCAGRKSSRSSTVTLFDDAPTEADAAVREAWNGKPPNHRAR